MRAGHPWIFRDALRPPGQPPRDGDVVLVTTGDGKPLGRGFWTASTPIAVRMLTTDAGDQIPALIETRFATALDRRLSFVDLGRTTAFRWVHGEADLLPGLHLDVYGDVASARFDGAGARVFYGNHLPALAAAGRAVNLRAVVERAGRRGGHGAGDGAQDGATTLWGQPCSDEIEVLENGLRFGVDLMRGQKGGLFLDQRDNRERVRALSAGRDVLNLFGYTGGFSVYAASGGARGTTTVDSSVGAIAAAGQNFVRNGMNVAGHRFEATDVFAFLAQAGSSGARWDVVISDPPTFAPSRRALPEALRAYRRLHRMCAAVVEPGGILCAASCSSHVAADVFAESVEAGCADAGRRFHMQEQHGAPPDHPVLAAFPEGRYLKFVIGTVT